MQSTKLFVLFAVLLALAPISAFGAGRAFGGAVYAMSNASEGNEIVVFDRDIHGGLTRVLDLHRAAVLVDALPGEHVEGQQAADSNLQDHRPGGGRGSVDFHGWLSGQGIS